MYPILANFFASAPSDTSVSGLSQYTLSRNRLQTLLKIVTKKFALFCLIWRFNFFMDGVKQTALLHVGIRSPQCYASFAFRQRRASRGQARAKFPSGNLCRANHSLYGGLILYNENIFIKKEIFMKKYIFLFLGITILTACTSFQQQKFDWRGQNFDDFITQYGVPTSQHTLQNGNIAYSFIKPCQYTQGQEEAMVAVDSNNIITSVSKISSCPSAQQDKQYKEYVDPQVNYLKEKNAKREQEILEQTQDRIYKVEHELFELNYDHSYELAVNSAENNLKATEGNYAQWKKHYEEKHKKYTDILKSHGIKQDSTITNMINNSIKNFFFTFIFSFFTRRAWRRPRRGGRSAGHGTGFCRLLRTDVLLHGGAEQRAFAQAGKRYFHPTAVHIAREFPHRRANCRGARHPVRCPDCEHAHRGASGDGGNCRQQLWHHRGGALLYAGLWYFGCRHDARRAEPGSRPTAAGP